MHVALVAGNLVRIGGIETQTLLMARELMKLGLAVTVVTLGSVNRRSFPDLRVLSVPWELDGQGTLPALAAAFGWLYLLLKADERFTVLQAQSVHPMGMAVAVAGRLRKLPTVARVSSSGSMGEIRALLRRPLASLRTGILRWIDAYVCLTSSAVYDIPPNLTDRAVVIPNGVDRTRFRPPSPLERSWARQQWGLDEDSLVYCYTGRLLPFKAVDELLDAWMQRRPHNGTLLIVGDGTERNQLQSMASEAKLGNSVIFAGASEAVPVALWASDILVQPSRIEGFSNSVLEAMACGLPVLARNLDCYTDLLEGECRFNDVAELEELLVMASDAGWRRERARFNLERASHFDSGHVAHQYLELYRKLVN